MSLVQSPICLVHGATNAFSDFILIAWFFSEAGFAVRKLTQALALPKKLKSSGSLRTAIEVNSNFCWARGEGLITIIPDTDFSFSEAGFAV